MYFFLNVIFCYDVPDRVFVSEVLLPEQVHWLQVEEKNDAHIFVLLGDEAETTGSGAEAVSGGRRISRRGDLRQWGQTIVVSVRGRVHFHQGPSRGQI